MVRTRKIGFSGIRPPKLFSQKTRCHIDPTVRCYDKSRCATCKVSREARQIFLIQSQITKPKRSRRKKNNPSLQAQPVEVTVTDETQKQVMCAYCLYIAPLNAFLISTKKGFHKSQAKCPDCHNGQLIKTLTTDMTPEQYAEWMFANMSYGGWHKVPWTKWKERLHNIGWSIQFWAKYKQLKEQMGTEQPYPQDTQEQYEEFIRRHGEET